MQGYSVLGLFAKFFHNSYSDTIVGAGKPIGVNLRIF